MNIGLPSLLLVLVVTTHVGYDVLASFYENHIVAAKVWFYVLRGIEGTILYLIVWALTPWKPRHLRLAVSTACAWGALEELQTAACGAAMGFEKIPRANAFQGLCDVVTGWPVYACTLLAVLLIFAFSSRKG